MMTLKELRGFLHAHLTEDVIPFWFKHSIDWQNGGLFSYLADDGTILDRKKSMISNTRALWTFSALVNRIGKRKEWVEAAENQFDFLKVFGRDAEGRWAFVLAEDGAMILGQNSIIVDAFAIAGLVEYYRMSRDPEALEMAVETYHSVKERLARPGSYKTAPYPTPEGMRAQREAMQFSLMFSELGDAAQDDDILAAGTALGHDVLDHFWRPEKGVLLEYVGLDNQPRNTPAGRCMVPGHAIETLWFQVYIFSQLTDNQPDCAVKAAKAIQPCLERGWDAEHGGILLGIDVEGKQPVYWQHAEMKRWWPATEAMAATLLAYEQLHEQWCLDWYWRVHDWAFEHFHNTVDGEWFQNLTREGKLVEPRTSGPQSHDPNGDFKNFDLSVKDPFHLPRALIVAINTLDRIVKDRG